MDCMKGVKTQEKMLHMSLWHQQTERNSNCVRGLGLELQSHHFLWLEHKTFPLLSLRGAHNRDLPSRVPPSSYFAL